MRIRVNCVIRGQKLFALTLPAVLQGLACLKI